MSLKMESKYPYKHKTISISEIQKMTNYEKES